MEADYAVKKLMDDKNEWLQQQLFAKKNKPAKKQVGGSGACHMTDKQMLMALAKADWEERVEAVHKEVAKVFADIKAHLKAVEDAVKMAEIEAEREQRKAEAEIEREWKQAAAEEEKAQKKAEADVEKARKAVAAEVEKAQKKAEVEEGKAQKRAEAAAEKAQRKMAADEEKRQAVKKVEAELQKANKSNSKKHMVIDPPDIPKHPRPQPCPILCPVLGPLEDPMGRSALESQNGDYCKATRALLVELVMGQYE
ncbi:hypothetical protein L208DRAFT_1397330 [Tricholoma matsutake]|nr:hypothetical protein L208DRAFT_1397330 [Tricholoma matsutake 945]